MSNTHTHDNFTRCQQLLGQLNEYADGELAIDLCHELELHLTDCTDCKIVFDTLTKTIKLYHLLDENPEAIPAGVEERLLRRLNLVSS
ncbi:MAG: zf-HC2 domain-containing protein [Chloroflexi bacterium SZAS-1]|jgi:predicted anti-sigma-YlaC factor YlaD|nr:zf-HC2 domain-containing protein [Chloroflexi bacterium SZAS-1]HNP85368.1 zf-HC2 domain-containing protein [Kouleothrix sp.]